MKIRSGFVLKSQVLLEQLGRVRVRSELVFALLLCLGSVPGWALQSNQQQMRGLDEEVQQIK